jgi:hypothetical protein
MRCSFCGVVNHQGRLSSPASGAFIFGVTCDAMPQTDNNLRLPASKQRCQTKKLHLQRRPDM